MKVTGIITDRCNGSGMLTGCGSLTAAQTRQRIPRGKQTAQTRAADDVKG